MTSAYKTNFGEIDWNVRISPPRRDPHMAPARSGFAAPMVIGDFTPYDCPITGKMIEGRRAHEENLKRHDCRILEPGERADNTRNGQLAIEAENKKRDAAIDGIVDAVANEVLG